MNHKNQQSLKENSAPVSKYDYDGITGTWLLIPARIHLLLLAVVLPVIIWVLPNIHFKGNFRYIFVDYRYLFAGAFALFCIASALLSIVKAKQVKSRIRPTNSVRPQIIAKTGPGRPVNQGTNATAPNTRKTSAKETVTDPKSPTASKPSVIKKKITQQINTKSAFPQSKPKTATKTVAKQVNAPRQTKGVKEALLPSAEKAVSAKKAPTKPKQSRRKPEQMKLDI